MSDPQTSSIGLRGIEMAVLDVGRGAPVLFLHGLTAAAGFHRPEIDALAAHRRVIAPDLRGHGRTTRPTSYRLADHVADSVALLDALGIDVADVVGVSMGSYVAQALALDAPDRVRSLTLVVAKSNGLTSSSARVLAEHADEVAGLDPASQQAWLADRMFAPQTGTEVRERVLGWFTAQHVDGLGMTAEQVRAANDALAGFDFRPGLPTLDVPTLVVSGRHDIFNPPAEGLEIASLVPGARLELIEDGGHFLTAEHTTRFATLVDGFLAG